jgi:oligosaccharyltransferase complex subunit epsilon
MEEYSKVTPNKIQVLDLFLLFSLLLGALQIAYILIVGQFPYNSFLSSLFATAGFFVLLVCLRLQIVHPQDFGNVSAENAFASFIVCNLLLFFVVTTFMG